MGGSEQIKTGVMSMVLIGTVIAAIGAPPAQAQSRHPYGAVASCRSAQTTGAVVGGLLGAGIGRSIAGRGRGFEGAVLGGAFGALAGSQIARGLSQCEQDLRYAVAA